MGARHFCPPLNPPAKIQALIGLIKRKTLLFTLHIALESIPTKWSNTLKQFVGNLPTNCLSVFDHFVGLVLKGLRSSVFQLTMNHDV